MLLMQTCKRRFLVAECSYYYATFGLPRFVSLSSLEINASVNYSSRFEAGTDVVNQDIECNMENVMERKCGYARAWIDCRGPQVDARFQGKRLLGEKYVDPIRSRCFLGKNRSLNVVVNQENPTECRT
jgi:hypothetical protein